MLKEKLKAIVVKQEEKDSKKKIENIVVFVLVLIVTIIAINAIWSDNENITEEQEDLTVDKQLASENTNEDEEEEDMQTDLEAILSKINGVGKVKVLISYLESSEVVAMYNESSQSSQIEETDSNGGTRTTTQEDTQKDIVYEEVDGDKVPITQKVVSPKIEGAIITAEGARKCKCEK
jgi:stage III sporulation protein AG